MSDETVSVSIIVPCHNSAAFIGETAHSALSQTFRDYEVIFIDDGSTDATKDVITSVMAEHSDRLARLIRQPDSGLAASRNRGVAEACGRHILPLDSDDLIDSTMLEACARVLDEAPDIAIVHADREDFGELNRIQSAGRYELGRLKYFNQINYCSLYRRCVWEAIGGYRTNVSGLDDWDFWIAAASRGFQAHYIAKPFLKHRTRARSLMWRLLPEYERLHARIVLNNREAYTEAEGAEAERFLTTGAPAPFLCAARRIFMAQSLG